MTVFTIFCHGTNSHRSRTDSEIVAEFGRAASGEEYRDYLILDGPGSSGTKANPMPGQFNPFTKDKTGKALFGNREMGHGWSNTRIGGLLLGKGWDDNVIHAVAAIAELDPVPTTINMIGWSRGGVTCAKVAYVLNEFFPQMKVNIFAVDPVAGPGARRDKDASRLESNVRNYVATLALHDQRGAFAPQSIARMNVSKGTNSLFLPFPGRHDTQVTRTSKPAETAIVVWDLAWKFLNAKGTKFDSILSPGLSRRDYCNYYGRIRVDMPDYRKLRHRWYNPVALVQGGVKARDFTRAQEKYTIDSHYFVNDHHRIMFALTYPKVYEFLFEGKATSGERAVWQEFKTMFLYRGLMESLRPFGVAEPSPGHPFVLPVPGSGHKSGSIATLALPNNMELLGLL